MKNKQAILVLIVFIFVAGYGYTYIQVSSAIQNLEIEISDVRIEGISLFPPSADVVYILVAINPSGYELDLRIDADMYYGNILITPIDVTETIRANGRSTFEVPVHISSSIISVFAETSYTQLTTEGKVTVTHRIFGVIPIVFTRTEVY